MNFKETMIQRLQEDGMLESQARTVMDIVVKDRINFPSMIGRWHDQVDGYPPLIAHLTYLSVQEIAYKWICEHAPKAWYRVAFSPGVRGLKGAELERYIEEYHQKVQEEVKQSSGT